MPASLDLTRQAVLDALGLDDRVSTGRIEAAGRADPDPLLETCGRLADAVFDWWQRHPPPLVYRTRSMPSIARSVAFTAPAAATATAAPAVVSVRRLAEATALHAHLVVRAGFTVPPAWLE